jgi:hypothetical protein
MRKVKKMKMAEVKTETEIPEEWVSLFLNVADLMDGGFWEDKGTRQRISEAYYRVFETKQGNKIYEDACDDACAKWL